jgi:Polysaccharide biosynthesis protein.
VLLQQLFVRGLVAVKFLALGRILGPSAIGSVSIALLAVAIAESLSDTGLPQAVIQGGTRRLVQNSPPSGQRLRHAAYWSRCC